MNKRAVIIALSFLKDRQNKNDTGRLDPQAQVEGCSESYNLTWWLVLLILNYLSCETSNGFPSRISDPHLLWFSNAVVSGVPDNNVPHIGWCSLRLFR